MFHQLKSLAFSIAIFTVPLMADQRPSWLVGGCDSSHYEGESCNSGMGSYRCAQKTWPSTGWMWFCYHNF